MRMKAVVGLRPSFSAHVRWGERGAPLWSGDAAMFGLLRHVWSGDAAMFGLLRHVWSCGASMYGSLFLFLALTAASGHAQQIGQNTSSSTAGTYTLTAKSQLVVETVVVKDKEGKFVPGLSAKDFTVTEDGTP